MPTPDSTYDWYGESVPRSGPINYGGAWYSMIAQDATSPFANVWKNSSSDGTGSWSRQDQSNEPAGSNYYYDVDWIGDNLIHFIVLHSFRYLSYAQFDMDTDSWWGTGRKEILDEGTYSDEQCWISVRSNGDIWVLYCLQLASMDDQILRLAVSYDDGANWTTGIDPSLGTPMNTREQPRGLVWGVDDKLYLFFSWDDGNGLRVITMNSSEVWDGTVQLIGGAGPEIFPISFTDDSEVDKVAYARYYNPGAGTGFYYEAATCAQNPSFSSPARIDDDSSLGGINISLAAFNGIPYGFWARGSGLDRVPYYNYGPDWNDPTEFEPSGLYDSYPGYVPSARGYDSGIAAVWPNNDSTETPYNANFKKLVLGEPPGPGPGGAEKGPKAQLF